MNPDIDYLDPLVTDRVLTPEQRAEFMRVIRAVLLADDADGLEIRQNPDVDIPGYETIAVHREPNRAEVSIEVFRTHCDDETIQVDAQEMVDCTQPHTTERSTMTKLQELDPEKARDILSIVAKMCGIRPSHNHVHSHTFDGLVFQSLSCLDGVTEFSLVVGLPDPIQDLYRTQNDDMAERLDIPITPTQLELEN